MYEYMSVLPYEIGSSVTQQNYDLLVTSLRVMQ